MPNRSTFGVPAERNRCDAAPPSTRVPRGSRSLLGCARLSSRHGMAIRPRPSRGDKPLTLGGLKAPGPAGRRTYSADASRLRPAEDWRTSCSRALPIENCVVVECCEHPQRTGPEALRQINNDDERCSRPFADLSLGRRSRRRGRLCPQLIRARPLRIDTFVRL
jgi:hypothetical protein